MGGGGGVGGFNVTGSLGFGGTAGGTIGVGLGGSGGSGGSAMKVTAGLVGIASTDGDRSGAILAQSIGGGGGAGAFNISAGIAAAGTGAGSLNIGLGGTGGTAGHGGEVALTVVGHALTDGVQSDGIVAQSVAAAAARVDLIFGRHCGRRYGCRPGRIRPRRTGRGRRQRQRGYAQRQ